VILDSGAIMRKILFALVLVVTPSAAFAQIASPASSIRLTVDDAVKLALDHNPDLAAARFDPQIGDTRVAAAAGAFAPTLGSSLGRNNQLQAPAGLLVPTATRTDVVSSNISLNQRLPMFGTSYSLGWDGSHTTSNNFLNSYNPILRSGFSLNVSQPLLKDFKTDSARTQLVQSHYTRDVADAGLREQIVQTSANVKSTYWALVSAIALVEARQTAVDLAGELARVNKAKVDVGQSPPLDLIAAQAEVAANQEQLIIAETAVRQIEDRLRVLIFDPTDRSMWSVKIEPVDTPPIGTIAIDLDAAVSGALRDRTDLARARTGVASTEASIALSNSQRLPDVRLNASYQASGLGGTEILRTGGFPGIIAGPGSVTPFGSVLDQLLANDYPTWAVGVSVSYPIGRSTEEANLARNRLEHAQAGERVKSAEARVVQQVRSAAWKLDMNAKRIDVARASRELADERLDTERKRFDVGMSTSFLVIQAQRDLAQAKQTELAAVLGYDLALVEFEAIQQAAPDNRQ
jgi:outer membrane protein